MKRARMTGIAFGATAVALAVVGGAPAGSAAVAYPAAMAATGDSITRAYDVSWLGLLRDNPSYSWSTGTVSTVKSEYARLLAVDPTLSGHAYNDAKTGAKMADLDGQLRTAAGQAVQYATVLMGANDVCTSTIATMTPTATFESQFRQALTDLVQLDPGVKVAVSSIPNIYQLWNTLHTNRTAVSTWSSFGICQSMLSSSNTEAQRQQVAAQEAADNTVLTNVCAEFVQCHWDGGAAYRVLFASSDVSTVDYFHPSPSGQAKLAATEWAAGYWGSTQP